ncbi:MAG: dipicolinate synthase subunit DpsA [Clostridia bacterium]|nr:dipicolinate synthase subunit DpsA [Clostridia bacterium]
MNSIKIAVLGGDLRQSYIITELIALGYSVSAYGIKGNTQNECASISEALDGADAVILPYPISPDGVFLNAVCEDCNVRLDELFSEIKKKGVRLTFGGGLKSSVNELAEKMELNVTDYGRIEAVMIKNALCTAEGAIEIAMRELPTNLHGLATTVIGYGRIGRLLCHRLKALGCDVCVAARRSEALAAAETEGMRVTSLKALGSSIKKADIIFNTAPSLVLDKHALAVISADCLIIDLASAPGGVDFSEAERLGLKVIWALSLPGKYAPKSAASIICDEVTSHIENAFHLTRNL